MTSGTLISVTIEYFRNARYRKRHQVESHRTPRYRVRFELHGQPPVEAVVGPNPTQYLVADIRGSGPGDFVEVQLSNDGEDIVKWVNRTREELWNALIETGKCDRSGLES
ncbi:hypothetical protein PPGU19_092950 (plasmid) [Paraburkholderia sp. PGU19]|uniref:hypothetical protein n=1 Tax=Paraburkholderia sp. PGU19 TaxID=2735434 RepID=UPI0015DAC20A|nr:hypothetical protein [Paraburkholderia sp. PGU19]BCG04727.1 hypothetical protein PPGU19_092950 [Paraburkholderia sp. PGU19]